MTEGEPLNGNTLEIAGIRVSWFRDPGHGRPAYTPGSLPSRADVTLRITKEPPPSFPAKEKAVDSGQTWSLFHSRGRLVLQNAGLCAGTPPSRFLLLDSRLTTGDLHVTGNTPRDVDPLGYPLNQVLWILLLSQRRGLLFHACGIDDNGKGYLFLGNSGDGKSTAARLWSDRGLTVLNDDRIIVTEKKGVVWMHGTPWHGDFKEHSSRGLPVDKLFFLRHGKRNSSRAISGAEAVSMLLARSFPPLWDKEGMAWTVEFCQGLVSKTPCYDLSFTRSAGLIDFVRSL